MQAFILAALALVAAVSAQSAQINDYSDSNCNNFIKATTVPSNGGQCYTQNTGAHILVASEDCPVTVYTDSNCSLNGNSANVGSCRTGVASFSIDC